MTANTNVNTNNPYVNADGLEVKYGVRASTSGSGGTYSDLLGSVNITEFDVDYTTLALGTDGTHAYVLDYDTVLPASAVIEKCEFFVTTAWDSASSDVALNFGLIKRTDFTTIIDTDGLMDTVAKTVIDLAGNLVVTQAAGSYPDITTYAGAVIGTALSYDSIVVGYWETHVPTSGAGKLRIYWRMPSA